MKTNKLNKRAQEEITGFVMIIIIVAIIALVFLSISTRKSSSSSTESLEIQQFLESSMQYTTSCATSFEPAYSSLSELIRDCYEGRLCTSGSTACKTLEETLPLILDASWQTGENRPIKGYEFQSFYKTNSTQESIINITKGTCPSSFRSASTSISAFPGTIVNTLKICTPNN